MSIFYILLRCLTWTQQGPMCFLDVVLPCASRKCVCVRERESGGSRNSPQPLQGLHSHAGHLANPPGIHSPCKYPALTSFGAISTVTSGRNPQSSGGSQSSGKNSPDTGMPGASPGWVWALGVLALGFQIPGPRERGTIVR